MIIGILGLILAAAGLLLGGLSLGSNQLLGGSIIASVLAAVLLFSGARQGGKPSSEGPGDVSGPGNAERSRRGAVHASAGQASGDQSAPPYPQLDSGSLTRRVDHGHSEDWVGGDSEPDDPVDEPPIQRRPARVVALVARLGSEVLVIDGRPRYHVAECRHLVGRETESLPVSEANELGFTPCGWCEPDAVLVADSALS